MDYLHGIMQNYAWGSISAIADLRGVEPSGEPEAELWYGAHPAAPSGLGDSSTLLDRINRNPSDELGADVVETFGPRLPFLLKLLAADQPLSIQAHPSAEQARKGYDDEEARGVALSAANRTFGDPHHKPELILALTPFEALVGFRDFAKSAEFFRHLQMPARLIDHLENGQIIAAIRTVLAPADPDEEALVAAAVKAVTSSANSLGSSSGGQWSAEIEMLTRLSTVHEADPGLVIAALLNRLELSPGEGMYLDAGHMHAYIGGLAVEVMANSDNVVRGGLTHKHVDVPTLLDIVNPDPLTPERVHIEDNTYQTGASEFALVKIPSHTDYRIAGPAAVLAITDCVVVGEAQTLHLTPSEAAWVPAGESVTAQTNELAFAVRIGA